jgi:hypothetical protein
MLAEAIGGADGYHYIHGAGFTGLNVQRFPYTHPTISVYLTLVREQQDPDGAHDLQVELRDSSGQARGMLVQSSIELPKQPGGSDPLVLTYVGNCAGLHFPQPGVYWVTLSFDDRELDRLAINVAAHNPPQ